MTRPASRRTESRFVPNPFYDDDGTLVLTDRQTGRVQHMAIYRGEGRTDFLRRARHHLRVMNDPFPAFTPPPFRYKRRHDEAHDPVWE